ncbi:hypothetical protein EYF80_031645 [Liparis tanakae]|uniref:Uncharacterized protein n=1 Tax=Liparis tanakae TaxID=230148 RepID=A0A4Z2GZP6_9TELE|nr:hypothetical protein EYF80_031645 [Liparis tanakae]
MTASHLHPLECSEAAVGRSMAADGNCPQRPWSRRTVAKDLSVNVLVLDYGRQDLGGGSSADVIWPQLLPEEVWHFGLGRPNFFQKYHCPIGIVGTKDEGIPEVPTPLSRLDKGTLPKGVIRQLSPQM